MTSPPPPDPAPAPAGQGDSERIRRLEDHQQQVDGKLDKILGMLKPGDGADPVTQPGPAPAPAPDIGEQMRQAVRDVAAEQASAQPQQPPAETAPREIGVRGKNRLQARLFGKDPS